MNAGILPQARDFIFQLQFTAFQFGQFQVICRGVGLCILDFVFECLVPFFKFCKMRLDRHSLLLDLAA